MRIKSMQFKFLATIISAMLAITVFVGGVSIYEIDKFVRTQTESLINITCDREISQINDNFGDMEKSVHIMENYVYGLLEVNSDVENPERQDEIMALSADMFVDVAKHTEGAVAYYLRFDPEISHGTCGFFYSKAGGKGNFLLFDTTDLLKYDKNDNQRVGWYWQPYNAGKPIWLAPYYNKNNGTLMISYVVPLYLEEKFIGVVGMDFDYNVLTDRVHKIKIYDHGFAHLEFEGADIFNSEHTEDVEIHEHPENYLSVSKELKNGMTLVISASRADINRVRYNIEYKILFVVLLLAIVFSAFVIFIVRRIVYPLKKLTDASEKLSKGDYNVELAPSNTYEIKLLGAAFENMARNLEEHEKIQSLMAYRDSLTGLKNTNSYRVWVSEFDKATEKPDIGIVMLDLNFLKRTNDTYGHDVGDKLISTAAQLIAGIFKRSPVFRIGGDEFLVVLLDRDLEECDGLLKMLDAENGNTFVDADGEKLPVSLAVGFARYDPKNDLKFVDIFNRADDAMYGNKRRSKGMN